jgi:16S rRNA (uracil1498-N3)-methyltransferase
MTDGEARLPRLYVDAPLASGRAVALDGAQANYLFNVMRRRAGDPVLVFNGRDGEWRATLAGSGRKSGQAVPVEQARPQASPGDLHLLFAPLKHARLDYLVQKAVELGASRLVPVITQHTQVTRVNLDRMRANAIEAAEQCGLLSVAEISQPVKLRTLLAEWVPERLLVFCDEEAPVHDPVAMLKEARSGTIAGTLPVSVLIGPEGGFSADERDALLKLPDRVRLSLGPRTMRADTAAVAVLALVQAVLGDWR